MIGEIRQMMEAHPKYRGDAKNVYNKFSFKERPARGVIVENSTAERAKLSAQNYVGRLKSYVMLTPFENAPGTTIEWVRENYALLEKYSKRRDIFPSHPGVYIVSIMSLPDQARDIPGKFMLKPHMTVNGEPLFIISDPVCPEAQLGNFPIYNGALRLWLYGRRPLLQDVDYSVDWEHGVITFLKQLPNNAAIDADYRYIVPDQGPFDFMYEQSNITAIPGAVLAFGDRAQLDDKLAIVVTSSRADVAEVYGGRFETNFSLNVFSKDAEDREKLSDYLVGRVLESQNAWGFEGIELLDITPGGENETVYNQEIDDYYYESSVSMSLRVDWESYIPLPIQNFRIEQTSKSEEDEHGYADGTVEYDLLHIGTKADMAGSVVSIGKQSTFSRII